MNTTTFLIALCTAIAVFALASCGACSKKVDCPGYKDDILDAWFPYTDNQQLYFKNEVNETDTFSLKNTFTTAPYQETSGWERSVVCSAEKRFATTPTDTAANLRFSVELLSEEQFKTANLYLHKTRINIEQLTEATFSHAAFNSNQAFLQVFPSITIGNKTFINVTEARRDTSDNKAPGIYRLFVRKNEGIVAYSEYPSLKTWVKQ